MTSELSALWVFLGVPLFLATLPGTMELLLVTTGAFIPPRKTKRPSRKGVKLAVLIPAFNEEINLSNTLGKLRLCTGSFSVIVIADNCTDKTSEIAQKHGVEVLIRNDPSQKGKHHALRFAFSILKERDFTHYIILDADTEPSPNFVEAVSSVLEDGVEAAQTRYGVLKPERSLRTRLMNIAFLAFNYLRPLGREGWGLSSGILGNGFVLSKSAIQNVSFEIDSIVEDLAYHLKLVKAGYRVRFIPEAAVYGEMPMHRHGASIQRIRWEGGRFRVLVEEFPKLLKAVLQGHYRLIEPMLELLSLPSAYHVLLLFILLLVPWPAGQWMALLSLGVFACYIVVALWTGKASWRDYAALLLAPIYLVWKITILISTLKTAKKNAEWERTPRENDETRL